MDVPTQAIQQEKIQHFVPQTFFSLSIQSLKRLDDATHIRIVIKSIISNSNLIQNKMTTPLLFSILKYITSKSTLTV